VGLTDLLTDDSIIIVGGVYGLGGGWLDNATLCVKTGIGKLQKSEVSIVLACPVVGCSAGKTSSGGDGVFGLGGWGAVHA
jgi:hypothetical protein